MRRRILLSKGYEVIIATEGDEEMNIDLVISDHFLRGVTGGELASKMKAIRPAVPIILISGVPERPAGPSSYRCEKCAGVHGRSCRSSKTHEL